MSVPHESRYYRPDIDGMRAVALFAAVGGHVVPDLVTGGFIGVDMFFVISGFLITQIILRAVQKGTFSFLEFYARRVRRIFPALIAVLVFCFVVGWFQLWANELRHLGKHILSAVGFVSNFVLWSEAGYFDAASETKPLLHLWSLGIEEQFYLIWPLLVWWTVKRGRGLAPLMAFIFAASFAMAIGFVIFNRSGAYYLPFGRFWELMAGCALAYAYMLGRMPEYGAKWKEAQSAVGLTATVASMFLLTKDMAIPGAWVLIPVCGTIMMITAGPEAWVNRRILRNPVMVLIGLISYPVYLWHWPLLAFQRIRDMQPPALEMRLAAVAVSVVLGWVTYRLLELPIRSAKGLRLAPALCTCLACIGIVALATSASNGIPSRYPKNLEHIDRYSLMSDEVSQEWRRHRCMLEKEGVFAPECVDAQPASAPLLVLWGDSHAAALYPGLRDQQEHYQFRIAQFSASRCPPMLDYVIPDARWRNPHCAAISEFVASQIRERKPSVVVMEGHWERYDPSALRHTFERLKGMGVQRIVLVGNVPVWRGHPARLVFHLFARAGTGELPERVALTHFRMPRRSDRVVAEIAREAGVEFLSLLDPMCEADGCLAFAGNDMAYSDADHLAPPGARYLAKTVFRPILEGLDPAAPSRRSVQGAQVR